MSKSKEVSNNNLNIWKSLAILALTFPGINAANLRNGLTSNNNNPGGNDNSPLLPESNNDWFANENSRRDLASSFIFPANTPAYPWSASASRDTIANMIVQACLNGNVTTMQQCISYIDAGIQQLITASGAPATNTSTALGIIDESYPHFLNGTNIFTVIADLKANLTTAISNSANQTLVDAAQDQRINTKLNATELKSIVDSALANYTALFNATDLQNQLYTKLNKTEVKDIADSALANYTAMFNATDLQNRLDTKLNGTEVQTSIDAKAANLTGTFNYSLNLVKDDISQLFQSMNELNATRSNGTNATQAAEIAALNTKIQELETRLYGYIGSGSGRRDLAENNGEGDVTALQKNQSMVPYYTAGAAVGALFAAVLFTNLLMSQQLNVITGKLDDHEKKHHVGDLENQVSENNHSDRSVGNGRSGGRESFDIEENRQNQSFAVTKKSIPGMQTERDFGDKDDTSVSSFGGASFTSRGNITSRGNNVSGVLKTKQNKTEYEV